LDTLNDLLLQIINEKDVTRQALGQRNPLLEISSASIFTFDSFGPVFVVYIWVPKWM